ncbi:MFS general substrate transporter [Meredithblackwellia eburnea MCA 4105]
MTKVDIVLQDQSSRLAGSKLLVVFFGLQIALFLSFLDSTSVSTALPIIGRDLNASESITWVGTSFLVANTSFQIVTSRLSDIFGRKVVLIGSLALFVIGDLLCGFAQNAIWLYCCRALAGIGGGGINSLSMIIMSDVVSLRDRGKYQGLLGIAISLGSGVGPFMGGLFAQKSTWRWTFWISPPLGVVTIIIIWFLLPLTHVTGDFGTKLKQMDWLGTFLSLAMTVCSLVPLAGGGTTFPWNGSVVIALFVVSGVAAVAFITVQAFYAKLPLLPMSMFKNYNIALVLFQTWLVGIVFYGNVFYVPIYAQNVLGMGAIESAAVLLPLVLAQTFTTTLAGLWVKRTAKTKSSLVVGFVWWFAGQAAQLCFKRGTSVGVIVGVLLVQGMGAGATLQSTLVLAQASGPAADRAVVTGARNFARTSGGAIGLAMANTILNNIFIKNLPASVPATLKEQLRKEFVLPSDISVGLRDSILDAYMVGVRDVFIFFIPVMGVCLAIGLILKVRLKAILLDREVMLTHSTFGCHRMFLSKCLSLLKQWMNRTLSQMWRRRLVGL